VFFYKCEHFLAVLPAKRNASDHSQSDLYPSEISLSICIKFNVARKVIESLSSGPSKSWLTVIARLP
jgi:hypothetical protein